ncbi:uncharacterized protein LOC128200699 [Galleria mellonella]|uniref:Uncharacterized protein LOC128200699 n=1 Tax=Galleria mellonella TaxID=7137 RepID=A0ABM3MIB9_GALME|nr:uncharacterized protein LOC128200699 [Galleria mellonella]
MQRGFAIRIIRAFRTVSTTAAIALAELTPLDLKVLEVHHLEQTRLTGSTHLLRSDLSLERPTPPHKLLHPAVRVSITSLPYSSLTTSQSSLTIYTDGSKLENSDTGAAFVAYSENKQIAVKKFKLHRSCSVFQAELLAILKACTWANSFHPHSHITIITDSQAALAALRDRSNTHPLVSQTHAQIHSRTSGSLSFVWVKGHIGVDGNEAADSAAKYAAASHSSLSYASYPMSFVKHNIRAEHNRIWQARYESSSQGRHTISLLPKLTDITRFRQLVKTSFHITQILTGHGYTKQYLHRFNIAADDACPCDDSTTQTFEHLLEHCPRFSPKRLNHVLLCNNLRLPPFNILELLKHESAISSFDTFAKHIITNLKAFNGQLRS